MTKETSDPAGSPASFSIEEIPLHEDARGWVFEPVEPGALARQGNAHLVLTKPGEVRGNHYHERGTEIAVIVGPSLVRIQDKGEFRDFEVPSGRAHRFVFPPKLPHAIKNTGQEPAILIGFNTEIHDPQKPDVVRMTLL